MSTKVRNADKVAQLWQWDKENLATGQLAVYTDLPEALRPDEGKKLMFAVSELELLKPDNIKGAKDTFNLVGVAVTINGIEYRDGVQAPLYNALLGVYDAESGKQLNLQTSTYRNAAKELRYSVMFVTEQGTSLNVSYGVTGKGEKAREQLAKILANEQKPEPQKTSGLLGG